MKVTKCGYQPVSLFTVPKRLLPCYHWQLLFSSLLKIYDKQVSVITTWVVKHYGNVVWHLTFQVAIVVSWLWYIIYKLFAIFYYSRLSISLSYEIIFTGWIYWPSVVFLFLGEVLKFLGLIFPIIKQAVLEFNGSIVLKINKLNQPS